MSAPVGSFVLTDSLEVKTVAIQLSIIGHHPRLDRVLLLKSTNGYAVEKAELLEIDYNGNIVYKLPLVGEDSLSLGQYISGLCYSLEGGVFLMTDRGLFAIDKAKGATMMVDLKVPVPLYLDRSMTIIYEEEKPAKVILSHAYDPTTIGEKNMEEFWKKFTYFTVVDLVSGTYELAGTIPDGSDFWSNPNNHNHQAVSAYSSRAAFVAYGSDQKVWKYDLEGFNSSTVDLAEVGFRNGKSNDPQNPASGLTSSIYRNVVCNGDTTFVMFSTGIPPEIYNQEFRGNNASELYLSHSKVIAAVIVDNHVITSGIQIPARLIANGAIRLNDGQYLFAANGGLVELEQTERLYKGSLIIE